MSEALPGLPPAPPAPRPRDAAIAVLIRRAERGVEVFWMRRGPKLRFAGGFYAFPGGKVDPADADVPVEGALGEEAVLRAAAAREAFEEAGVLLAPGGDRLGRGALSAMRQELVEGRAGFGELLRRNGLTLVASELPFAGRWITPPFLPVRFDARFFLVEVAPGTELEAASGEAVEAEWIRPADAIRRWEEGSALLHPPTLHVLRCLERFPSAQEALPALANPPHCPGGVPTRIEFQRGIRLVPVETPTLPPARHTNAYLVGNGELLVIDPGSADVGECARVVEWISELGDQGMRPKAVLLTHHHADHVGGTAHLAQRLGVPIWAHARTAERLPVPVGRQLEEGEILTLNGSPAVSLQVLHTPGHARGHLCLVDLASRAAIVGDMVAGVGTILIDPPEGDMGEYLRQLRRLKELPVGALYPAHGPPMADGAGKLEEYLRHREMREQRVLEAIPPEGAALEAIVAQAYADTASALWPLAERSTRAILIKLESEGRVRAEAGRYARC